MSYADARRAWLAEEIERRRHIAALRRSGGLPAGPVIAKACRFRDAQGAKAGLIDLFGEKDPLVAYFGMYGPQRERPCPMCVNLMGPLDGAADIKHEAIRSSPTKAAVSR